MKTRVLALVCLFGLVAACGEDAAATDETEATSDPAGDPAADPAADPATDTEPAEPETPPTVASGGGSCGRVEACCRAFHDAEGFPSSPVCDGFRMAARAPERDDCEPTIAGYRRTLVRDGHEVPPVCQ